ncbi:MAG: PIN domain-containing protein [Gammaproteobacteria bacterium]|nr:PIN domain-containing protein [Gammaproteobacteria bacterium]
MILVDSSVWIAYFNGIASRETDLLDRLLETEPLCIGDLILTEVLQGFRADADYRRAKALLEPLRFQQLGGRDVALAAAVNYRHLRRRGVTVRKTIDMIIATWCLLNNADLLHPDRDFDVIAKHFSLRCLY